MSAGVEDIKMEALSLSEGIRESPVCIIVLGMAGSGKTTFTRSLIQHAQEKFNPYVVNLDPACREVPYAAHVDIRDTVNYREVMKQYHLGPNGGIVTALNMFTTKMSQFAELVRRAGERGHKWCVIDTPGQIEVFTWSASGNIITEGLATLFPTVVVYVMDVVRSACPTTFMSNMLYACSILYKTRLPFLVALNKIDLQDCSFVLDWMTDFETFQEALEQEQSFVSNLTRTMSLTLDTFYESLSTCGVSAMTGVGFAQLLKKILDCVTEYERDYKPIYEKMRQERLADQAAGPKSAHNVEDAGVAVNLGLGIQDPPANSGSSVFLMAPGLVPHSAENYKGEDIEEDPKVTMEDQDFHSFVLNHLSAQRSKRDKLQLEQSET
ncbi:GPN-loop GTPase 1 [Drosophila biarmipes]|uniref:GPN-loop GTPase 1 n=1 Tax=Drosophila biarmipes TaxID=125945 RepID=UPI0007E73012|nr:GPN-loop GTPase 1 [Drosophila biarmipes]XP_016949533.1 GPN-loop GTPase 1 [Drosophila biarmipes]